MYTPKCFKNVTYLLHYIKDVKNLQVQVYFLPLFLFIFYLVFLPYILYDMHLNIGTYTIFVPYDYKEKDKTS